MYAYVQGYVPSVPLYATMLLFGPFCLLCGVCRGRRGFRIRYVRHAYCCRSFLYSSQKNTAALVKVFTPAKVSLEPHRLYLLRA